MQTLTFTREGRMGFHMDGWGMGFMGGGAWLWALAILIIGVLIGVLLARR
ncbi:hypothetical protein [Acuticoccus kandeliae]|nr:hypothetical protein [Acuticoccus kandeliae]